MVKDETHQQEIMKAFGFKTAAQAKAAYFRALVESGEVPGLVGGRGGGKAQKAKTVNVGSVAPLSFLKDLVARIWALEAMKNLLLEKRRQG